LVEAFPPPLGWTAQEVQQTALVARYHRGAEPRATHAGFHTLTSAARQRVLWLAGLLRLAEALTRSSGNRIARLKLERHPDADLIWAQGYVEDQKSAAFLGGRKHLLESVVERPVIIRAWPRTLLRAQGAFALGGTS
jgi:exopolyphosphatase/guanosine-5'-triphosphate,3'-diphosphate pyrophosphatase